MFLVFLKQLNKESIEKYLEMIYNNCWKKNKKIFTLGTR